MMRKELSSAFVDVVLKLGRSTACDRLLIVGDDVVDVTRLERMRKKVIFAVTEPYVAQKLVEANFQAVALPGFTASRTDRLKAALVSVVGAGMIAKGEQVICAIAPEPGRPLDTIMHITAGESDAERTSLEVTGIDSPVSPQLLEVLVHVALRIGRDGYEGRAVGTLIIVGDATKVMEMSHPLSLNPFQGYSEAERDLHDPTVREAVRTFALLDGAFVVREDGVVLAAGRHIHIPEDAPSLPLGLGSRHAAAASITSQTDALGIVVSQSSGVVRVFHKGEITFEIQPSGRRSTSPLPAAPSE